MGEGHAHNENDCLRRVMVLMMASDEDVDPDELATIIRVYREVTGETITEDDLRAEAEQVAADGMRLGECAGRLGAHLDREARLRVLGAAFAVAAADGFVVEEEDRLLSQIASDLDVRGDDYQHAIQRFLGRERP